jgi:hypothetical protein
VSGLRSQNCADSQHPMARDDAVRAARALERWGHERSWRGPDPYDGLNAAPMLVRRLRGSRLGLRLLTQVVKRSPLDLRPALRVPPGLSPATLGLVISAYSRNGFVAQGEARDKLRRAVTQLEKMRCPTFPEPCWSYHFDVQTRVLFYPQSVPNTIATAFAAMGLLDAYELSGEQRALELAVGTAEFFARHVPQTADGQGAYFGYLPGDRTPIHNASMLVCALFARLARLLGRDDLASRASAGVEYAVSHQRADGSWPYGETPGLSWVDGFHTGYVLDCLLTCVESGIGGGHAERAWRDGLRFYADALVDPDGTPRYKPDSRYPVDGLCAAQAIQTLARATRLEPSVGARCWSVFSCARNRLARRDGAFAFERERLWLNRTAHPRWVQAPMLTALTHLIGTA